jgi:hypothetical protein
MSMAIKLLAMVIALSAAHTLPDLARLRQFGWLAGWAAFLHGWFGGRGWYAGSFGALLVIGVPVLLLFGLQQALAGTAFGLASLALAVAALFYAWGPRDLALDVEAVVHAPDAERRRLAVHMLGADVPETGISGTLLVDAVFSGSYCWVRPVHCCIAAPSWLRATRVSKTRFRRRWRTPAHGWSGCSTGRPHTWSRWHWRWRQTSTRSPVHGVTGTPAARKVADSMRASCARPRARRWMPIST